MSEDSKQNIYFLPVMSSLFWAMVPIVCSVVFHHGFDPIYVSAVRFILGTFSLYLLMQLFSKEKIKLTRSNVSVFCFIGFIGVFLYNILFFVGLSLSLVVHSVAFMAMIPIWTFIVAYIFLNEVFTFQKALGVVLGFVGVIFILSDHGNGISSAFHIGNNIFLGDILFLLAALVFAFYAVFTRKFLHSYPPLAMTTYVHIFGTFFLLLFSLLVTDIYEQTQKITWVDSLAFIYLGLIGTAAAFFCWFRALSFLGPTKTAIFLNLVPVWGVLFSVFLIGETLSMVAAIGISFIIFGVFCVQSKRMLIFNLRPKFKRK